MNGQISSNHIYHHPPPHSVFLSLPLHFTIPTNPLLSLFPSVITLFSLSTINLNFSFFPIYLAPLQSMDPHLHASIPPAQIPTASASATIFASIDSNNHVAPPAPAPPSPATAPVANTFPAASTDATASGLYTAQQPNHPPYPEVINPKNPRKINFSFSLYMIIIIIVVVVVLLLLLVDDIHSNLSSERERRVE